ncbi:hypothetical protein C0991_007563 [Blastosporella zonata]|nr:hypothetical protein C0991_007563 [Blastosporella zonata]
MISSGSIKVIERFFDLPLDYSDPDGKKIRIFARNMIPMESAKSPEEAAKLPYRLSTPFTADTVSGKTDEEIFQYLKHFRADNIEGLKEVFITAGLPPLVDSPDTVYHALETRNAVYYEKYPGDVKRVRDILAYLECHQVKLPNGGNLTPSRFLQLGLKFGNAGGIDWVHQIVFRAANDLSLFGKLSYHPLQNIEQAQPFDSNPLYAILHESIYCQGRASNWSAERVTKEYPQHSWSHMKTQDSQSPVYFTGEMIFPDMFDDYSGLRPLKGAAQLLAKYSEWPQLYDLNQLSHNTVKLTAATNYTDMFVDFDFAQATASAVKNSEQYISNQHKHNALTKETQIILEQLFKLSKREYD